MERECGCPEMESVMVISTQKDPDSIEDFVLDWATNIGTDTISSASWAVTGGLVVDSSSATSTTTTVRLSGGTLGQIARATCTVTLASGQVRDQTIQLMISEQ